MPLDFPNNPAANQQWVATNGVTYQWTGTAWVVVTSGGGSAPYVLKAGDTMTGSLGVGLTLPPQAGPDLVMADAFSTPLTGQGGGLGVNAYRDASGAWRYLKAGTASLWTNGGSDTTQAFSAPSGAQDGLITWRGQITLGPQGNVRIGSTGLFMPNDVAAGSTLFVGAAATMATDATDALINQVAANAYATAGSVWKYIANGAATVVSNDGHIGAFRWYTASTGTAGGTITWVPRMTLSGSSLTMNGSAASWPGFILDGPNTTGKQILGQVSGSTRWVIYPGDSTSESGSNAGSNFSICRFNDSGTYIDAPLFINRASAQINTTGSLQVGGNTYNNTTTYFNSGSVSDFLMNRFYSGSEWWRYLNFSNNWYLGWCENGGRLVWHTPSGDVFTIDNGGNWSCNGAGWCNGRFQAQGGVVGNGGVASVGGAFYIDSIGNNYYLARDQNNGFWTFVEGGQWNFQVTPQGRANVRGILQINGGGVNYNPWGAEAFAFDWDGYGVHCMIDWADRGYFPISFNSGGYTAIYQNMIDGGGQVITNWYVGGAVFVPFSWSDRRLKSNIRPASIDALEIVNKLAIHEVDLTPPVNHAVPQHHDCSFVADEVRDLIPRAYIPASVEGSFESLRELPLVATLWRAVQQLSARLEALEGHAA